MKLLIKKAVCLLTVVTLISMVSVSYAAENTKNLGNEVICPEFPDAYIQVNNYNIDDFTIIQDKREGGLKLQGITMAAKNYVNDVVSTDKTLENSIINNYNNLIGLTTATVFVDEQYAMIDDTLIIEDSRLLTKSEVDTIGVENFEDLSMQTTNEATNLRGTLTITFVGYIDQETSTTSAYTLEGHAVWSGFSILYNQVNNPAVGEDYIGIAWGGDFANTGYQYNWSYNDNLTYTRMVLSDATPNAALVWSFNELAGDSDYMAYIDGINLSVGIKKNTRTGKGNTTGAVLKYIHTYQAHTGSISITASPAGVSSGFTLSPVSKQWSIACTMGNLYY